MFDSLTPAQDAVQGILQRIDALALKLGTTAQQLYAVYVHQARVEAIRDSLLALFGFVLLAISLYYAKRMWVTADATASYENTSSVIGCVIFIILALTGAVVFFIFAYAAVGETLNPQYWAFQHLTSDLKGLF